MPLIKMAIIMACAGTDARYIKACNATSEAVTKKVGFYDNAVQIEKAANKIALRKATNAVGEEPVAVAGAGIFAYKVVRDKSLAFGLPNFGVCNSLSSTVGLNFYQLRFSWNLP